MIFKHRQHGEDARAHRRPALRRTRRDVINPIGNRRTNGNARDDVPLRSLGESAASLLACRSPDEPSGGDEGG